ncbi:MAG: Ig-like domain-containing protein, partial [Planctomycetota bacterium]
TFQLESGGAFTYTPNDGFAGQETFFYRVTDGTLLSPVARVVIEVPAETPGVGIDPGDNSPPDSDNDDESQPLNPLMSPSEPADNSSSDSTETNSTFAIPTLTQESNEADAVGIPEEIRFAEPLQLREGDLLLPQTTNARSFSLFDSHSKATGVFSSDTAALERLLSLDLKESVVWSNWDRDYNEEEKENEIQVGVAGAGMALISVGYVAWMLRGGAITSILTSTIPAWRFIDPVIMLSAYQDSKKGAPDVAEDYFRGKDSSASSSV